MTINRARNLRKKLLEKKFLDLKKWVKSIQTASYNGARTVGRNIADNDLSPEFKVFTETLKSQIIFKYFCLRINSFFSPYDKKVTCFW